jgi:hypothetical protein
MASLDQEYSAFSIEDLSIVHLSGSQSRTINIRNLIERLEITENIISPVVMGSLLIIDTFSLAKILRTGSCFVSLSLSRTGREDFVLRRNFRIYKQEKRKANSPNSELYVLYFCSEELILSEQTRVSRGYTDTYTDIAYSILRNYLGIPENKCIVSDTDGVKNVVIPSLRPLDALAWCATRAVNYQNIPDILFFENKNGFNFISLADLYGQNSVPINFSVKNISVSNDPRSEYLGAKNSEITRQFNLLESIRKGTYSSSIFGYDLITGTFFRQDIKSDYYKRNPKLNNGKLIPTVSNKNGVFIDEAHDSKRTILVTDSQYKLSNYAKSKDPNNNLHEPELSLAHRSSVLSFLTTKKMKILLPGNFGLSVGMLVDLIYPKRGNLNNDEQDDTSFSGRQLIMALRHVITPSQHETAIEVASDSEPDGDL